VSQEITIDAAALRHNLGVLRGVLSPGTQLAAVIKANAYGHGLAEVASVVAGEVEWLAVHSPRELRQVRELGHETPVLVMGFATPGELGLMDGRSHLLVSAEETLRWLGELRRRGGPNVPVHLKVETGTNRQGVRIREIAAMGRAASEEGLDIVGMAMHFANIEDTLEPTFARQQLETFHRALEAAEQALGGRPRWVHAACSAAALLFREADFDLARVGISMYGHWPSRETQLAWQLEHGRKALELNPVLSWRTVVGQLKTVPAGETVGYGRTWTALRPTRLAILPTGYADGYPRALGNRARVLVRGVPAPVVGRVCMNITMVDVTDVPGAELGDAVTLIGTDGGVAVTAEELASHCGTINYEILARLSPSIPRRLVDPAPGSSGPQANHGMLAE